MTNSEDLIIGLLGLSGYLGGIIREEVQDLEVFDLGRNMTIQNTKELHLNLIIDSAFPTRKINKKIRSEYLSALNNNLKIANEISCRYIYIGSYSSHTKSRSKYGRLKREAERLVITKGGIVLRVGLVSDQSNPKGRFADFNQISRRLPFIPVLPNGWCPVFTTTIDEFRFEIRRLIRTDRVSAVYEAGVKTNISKLFQENNQSGKRCTIPETVLVLVSFLSRIVPLGRLDFVKSILYKEERF